MLPEIWKGEILNRIQKKSLLRCLIDKVVVHRIGRDLVRTRIIWKGGETSSEDLPIPVCALSELANAEELEKRILELAQKDVLDQKIAEQLTQEGFRSPSCLTLLESTVKTIRLRHGIMVKRHQSHPRRIPGFLTVVQVASLLQVEKHWVYDRIHKGTIAVTRDPQTKLYLFPDCPSTLDSFRRLQAGELKQLSF